MSSVGQRNADAPIRCIGGLPTLMITNAKFVACDREAFKNARAFGGGNGRMTNERHCKKPR